MNNLVKKSKNIDIASCVNLEEQIELDFFFFLYDFEDLNWTYIDVSTKDSVNWFLVAACCC